MKSCRKCFEYAYVFVGGDVRFCCWNGIVIGNLLENTLEEIWRGEKAEELRRAFMRGEMPGCSEQYCPDCIQKSTTLEIEEEELQRMYDEMPDLPTTISLAYDERCNHACPSCRHEFFCASEQYRENLKKITNNIEPYLYKVRSLAANGIGDLFVSHEMLDMLSRFHPTDPDFFMFLETNGVLLKDNWHKLEHLSKYKLMVSITPSSFDKETYRYLAGRDDLQKFEESLAFIKELKQKGDVDLIRIIMVIQDSNFRQIPDFIRKCIEYDADDIVLRPIFKWFGMTEDELLYKNVLNPCHPYHKEYLQIIEDPICKDPRVFNWGFMEEQEVIEFPTLQMKREYEGDKKGEERLAVCVNDLLPEIKKLKDTKIDRILLYGVGKVGKLALKCIGDREEGSLIEGYLVRSKESNPKYYMGYPIIEVDKYNDSKENKLVIVSLVHNNQIGVKQYLNEHGFENVIMIDEFSEEKLEI